MATSKKDYDDLFRSKRENKREDLDKRDFPDLNKGEKNWDSDNWRNSNNSDDQSSDEDGEITDRLGPMRKPESDEA